MAKPVAHASLVALTLAILWGLMSGHATAFAIGMAVVSIPVVLWLTRRAGLLGPWAQPFPALSVAWRYWCWLIWQILLSNVQVIRAVLHPRMPITPVMGWVPATQKTELGRATYCNSITLTPGTVTVSIEKDRVLVHALLREGFESASTGDMDRRVSELEQASGFVDPPPGQT